MTGTDRFGCVMSGKLPDRVPIICNLLEQGAAEIGVGIEAYYADGALVAEGQLALQQKYGYDQLWGFHYTAADVEMLGSSFTIFADDGPPNVGDLIIKSPEDIKKLRIHEGMFDTPAHQRLCRTISILKKAKGGELPVLGLTTGSFSLPPILMGVDKWFDLLYSDDDYLSNLLLDKCSDFVQLKIQSLFDAGIDMISYSNPLGTATFITQNQFKKQVLPLVQRDTAISGTDGIVYFSGGGVLNPMLEPLMANTTFSAFYIHPFDDIHEAKKRIGSSGILAAPINDIPLIHQSEQQIHDQVKKIMETGAPGGRFVFGTLVMPLAIPTDNIRYLMEAAKAYGVYND